MVKFVSTEDFKLLIDRKENLSRSSLNCYFNYVTVVYDLFELN